MRASRILFLLCTWIAAAHSTAIAQTADVDPELLRIIQQDLTTMGYDTGDANGEMTMQSAIAISRFQAEQGLEVTGQPSVQLAGVVKASMNNKYVPATATLDTTQPASNDAEALNAAQQACLQEKMAAAQANQKKKRGLGSLVRAVTRTAKKLGGNDVARSISETSHDVYDVNATAADLDSAAKDLGLTTDEVEECRNPPMQGTN